MTNTNSSKRRMAREPETGTAPVPSESVTVTTTPPDQSTPAVLKAPGKIDRVLDLLGRPEGATLDQLVEATGWLPHTTRAVLTGLRKKGHMIERTKVDGVSHYTVAQAVPE